MTTHLKVLPALALAAALVPLAAQARRDAPVREAAQQQFLVGDYDHAAGFALGRADAATASGNRLIAIDAEQFAAAVSAVLEED